MLEETGALIDPHTAVAAALMRRYQDRTGDRTPVVVVSTASPFKFGRAVADALGLDGVETHAPISLNEDETTRLIQSAETLKGIAEGLEL